MKNLLRLEFRRLSRSKCLYISFGLALLMLIWLTSSAKAMADMFDVSQYAAAATLLSVELLLSTTELSLFTTFLCVFVCIFVCEDYRQQTVKNILARGITRGQLYFAKLISALTATTVMFAGLLCASFFMNVRVLGSGNPVDWGMIFRHWGAQYVVTLAYLSLYFMLSVIFRKSGAAIAAGLLLPIIAGIVLGSSASDYWLGSLATELIYTDLEIARFWECLWVPVIYIAASLTGGYFYHKAADL